MPFLPVDSGYSVSSFTTILRFTMLAILIISLFFELSFWKSPWTDNSVAPDHKAVDDHSSYLGIKGRALTDLKPIGTVVLKDGGEEIRLECISEDGFLKKGAWVVVTKQNGPSLYVRKKTGT